MSSIIRWRKGVMVSSFGENVERPPEDTAPVPKMKKAARTRTALLLFFFYREAV
jgi:hypothetical protein